jgi:hypothetical protein
MRMAVRLISKLNRVGDDGLYFLEVDHAADEQEQNCRRGNNDESAGRLTVASYGPSKAFHHARHGVEPV